MDDALEEGAEQFLGKTAMGHARQASVAPVLNMAGNVRFGGLVNDANASDGADLMAGLDTSDCLPGRVCHRQSDGESRWGIGTRWYLRPCIGCCANGHEGRGAQAGRQSRLLTVPVWPH